MSSIDLVDGEYLIWSSPRSVKTEIVPQQAVGIFIIGFHVCIGMIVLVAFTGWPGFAATIATAVGLVLVVRWFRNRPAFFMTNKHLFDAGILFKQKIPLQSIQGCERYVAEIRTRYGMQRIATDKLVLLSAGQSVMFGPVRDFEGIWELIHHGVLTSTIQISALPSLDGTPASGEKRTDILFLLSTKTDGDEYGPLFIGPTKIIRFTEKLPSLLERILLTVAAAENTPEEMEHHLQQLVRHPLAGHSNTWERDLCNAAIQGNTLTLTTPERTITMDLRPGDVTRAAAFVRLWRPVHPMR